MLLKAGDRAPDFSNPDADMNIVDKYGISVRLLADKEQATCAAYGVLQDKEVDGVMRRGVLRSTFIIDKQGVIRHALYGVSSRGHAAEALQLAGEIK